MHTFQIREYQDGDIDGILALFGLSFQKESSEEWFRWKYQYSPFGSKGYVAIDGGMVVAFYCGIRLQFSFNGKTLWAYQFCDVMTHPEYRGRIVSKTPLIVRLGEMFYRETPMDFAFGFPSLRHARLQSIRLGGEGYRLVRLYKKGHLRNYSMLWKLKVKEGWEFFPRSVPPRLRVVPTFSKGGEVGLSGEKSLHLVKNEEYIRWRYRENPTKKYNFLVFKRMSRIKGFIIFIVEDNWFNILDILYEKDKDMQEILISLEDYIVKNMNIVKDIRMWFHPAEPVIEYLGNLGYSSEDSIPIAFRSMNMACGITSEIFYDRYFYRMGDYDAS